MRVPTRIAGSLLLFALAAPCAAAELAPEGAREAGYQDYRPQDYVMPPMLRPVTAGAILDGRLKQYIVASAE
jgi:hypothetical protein